MASTSNAATKASKNTGNSRDQWAEKIFSLGKPFVRLVLLMRFYDQERPIDDIITECKMAEPYVLGKDDSPENDLGDEPKEDADNTASQNATT